MALIYSASPLSSVNRRDPKLAVGLRERKSCWLLAKHKRPCCVPACGYIAWHGTSARPGSGSEAQRGGIGTESGRPCCDRDARAQPPDVIKHGTFAECANKPARCGTDVAARKRNVTV